MLLLYLSTVHTQIRQWHSTGGQLFVWVEFFKQDQKLVDIFDTPTSDLKKNRIMVNLYILYVYLEIRIQKDLCPIMNCRCNLNTFLRCYVRKVVIKNDNIKLHSACGRLHNGSESYLTEHSIALSISTWFFKYLLSLKNLVRWTGFFFYFALDFCRLHRQ